MWNVRVIFSRVDVVRLTKATDAALRIAMRVAVLDDSAAPTTQQVAEAVAISPTHAAKIVARLRELDVLETRRGRGGGLALTQRGRTASLGWLVRELEGTGDVVDCDGDPPCPLRSACRLRSTLRAAQEAFYATLDPITIEDLTAAPTGPVLLNLLPAPH